MALHAGGWPWVLEWVVVGILREARAGSSTRVPASAQPARETNPPTSVPYRMWAVSLTSGVWRP
jgi:hypothetical protein